MRFFLFFPFLFLSSFVFADEALWQMPEVQAFCQSVSADFKPEELQTYFLSTSKNERILSLVEPKKAPRNWKKYKQNFVNPLLVLRGNKFLKKHALAFEQAEKTYGVPREIIAAIIGIETQFGHNLGSFSTFEALVNLAFYDQRRADFFKNELKEFLYFTRENNYNPLNIKGSYAGALGIAQFMPSSIRRFAVDFDGNGQIDLIQSEMDAIGSVAAFLKEHGWQKNKAIAFALDLNGNIPDAFLTNVHPSLLVKDLKNQGFITQADDQEMVSFLDFESDQEKEFWLGLHNFEVITHYNRSRFYALSVFLLSEEFKNH